MEVHDNDRPGFDYREDRGDDLLRIGVEGVDRVDVPLDGNEPGSVDQVERLAIIAATGKPKVLRQDACRSLDRLLRELDLPRLLCSADASEPVTGRVKGRVRVTVVADFEIRVTRQFASKGRVDLGPHPGHEQCCVELAGLEIA